MSACAIHFYCLVRLLGIFICDTKSALKEVHPPSVISLHNNQLMEELITRTATRAISRTQRVGAYIILVSLINLQFDRNKLGQQLCAVATYSHTLQVSRLTFTLKSLLLLKFSSRLRGLKIFYILILSPLLKHESDSISSFFVVARLHLI